MKFLCVVMLDMQRIRSKSYHPHSNRFIERLQRTLTTALTTKLTQVTDLVYKLPIVMLILRAAFRTDTGISYTRNGLWTDN